MRVQILAVLLALVLAATGCAGDDNAGSAELQFVVFGDPTETAGYRTLLDAFKAANPDLDVALSPVATQDELLARLTTSFAGGAPPDVFLINYRKYGQFAGAGVLEPVQGLLDGSTELSEEDFFGEALDAFRFDGQTLSCMPQNASSLQVYVNRALFEQAGITPPAAGWTWADFLAAAQALTDADTDTYGLGTDPLLIRVAPFVWSNGGEIVDDEDAPTVLTLDGGPAREALDYFLDLRSEHGVTPPDAAEQAEPSEARFLAGRLGMYLNSRRSVPALREITGFEWDVVPLPTAPGGEPANILHGDAYCIASAGNVDGAWRLVEFAMSQEGQAIVAETGRTVPSRIDVANSDAFLAADQPPASSQVFLDVIGDVRTTPRTATWSQVEREADRVLEDIYYERVERDEGIARLIESTQPLFGPPS